MTALQIQSLIDGLDEPEDTRVTFVFPPGTHYLDRPLRITRSKMTLVGSPFGETKFDLPDDTSVVPAGAK